jgi:hypothetical protein
MRKGKDETGAGDDAFDFFDKVETEKAKYIEKWEDPAFRIILKLSFVVFLIGVMVNILIGLAKWWWL